MPAVRQPQSLVSLARTRVMYEILSAVSMVADWRRHGLDEMSRDELVTLSRDAFRSLWGGGALPAALRGQLLLGCAAELDSVTPLSFAVCMAQNDLLACLLASLLDADIAEVRVRLCCHGRCVHKDTVLRVLGRGVGAGLVALELSRPTVASLDEGLFQSILLSANNLTKLVLRNIACDRILKIIGNCCLKLEELDISHTRVTDMGILNLMYPQDEAPNDSPWPFDSPMCLLNNEYTKYSNESTLIRAIEQVDWPAVAADHGRPRPRTAARLCDTLRVLNAAETSVTRVGMAVALLSAHDLRSLGDRCHVGRALELLHKCAALRGAAGYRLTVACTCRVTAAKLRAVGATCPRLRALTVAGPLFAPARLGSLVPGALVRLNLKHVPADREWLDGLYAYLRGARSRALRRLWLKFVDRDRGAGNRQDGDDDGDDGDDDENEGLVQSFDLSEVLFEMPELDTLVLDGIEVTFATPPPPGRLLDRLRRVNFGTADVPETLARLVQCAPGLEVVHVYGCPGLDHGACLRIFLGAARLRCVYVNFVAYAGVDTVMMLTLRSPAIGRIGNVANWGFSDRILTDLAGWMTRNNIDVQLHDSAHWFDCSDCFA